MSVGVIDGSCGHLLMSGATAYASLRLRLEQIKPASGACLRAVKCGMKRFGISRTH